MNATATKLRKLVSKNRFGSTVERFQVLYLTDRWHEDTMICIDREMADRRSKELKRG